MEGRGLSPLSASVVWSSAGRWRPSPPGQLCPWLSILEAAGRAPPSPPEPAGPAGPHCVPSTLRIPCRCPMWSPLLWDCALKGTRERDSSLAEVTRQTATTPGTGAPGPGGMGRPQPHARHQVCSLEPRCECPGGRRCGAAQLLFTPRLCRAGGRTGRTGHGLGAPSSDGGFPGGVHRR